MRRHHAITGSGEMAHQRKDGTNEKGGSSALPPF
jgi:hypothetical protein